MLHSDISFEHSHKPFDFKGKLGGNTENWKVTIQSGLNPRKHKIWKKNCEIPEFGLIIRISKKKQLTFQIFINMAAAKPTLAYFICPTF